MKKLLIPLLSLISIFGLKAAAQETEKLFDKPEDKSTTISTNYAEKNWGAHSYYLLETNNKITLNYHLFHKKDGTINKTYNDKDGNGRIDRNRGESYIRIENENGSNISTKQEIFDDKVIITYYTVEENAYKDSISTHIPTTEYELKIHNKLFDQININYQNELAEVLNFVVDRINRVEYALNEFINLKEEFIPSFSPENYGLTHKVHFDKNPFNRKVEAEGIFSNNDEGTTTVSITNLVNEHKEILAWHMTPTKAQYIEEWMDNPGTKKQKYFRGDINTSFDSGILGSYFSGVSSSLDQDIKKAAKEIAKPHIGKVKEKKLNRHEKKEIQLQYFKEY